nr:xylulose kinase-1 [Tanacetum cinerariifolium]
MMLRFAETHNMVTYLSKSDASEGFNQIIDFLNGSSIKYALTVNPNIYVSCIKQFWTTVAVKKVNNVTRLQALVDKQKVVVTEATIRDALCLDDAEGVECLPNEEIFAALARMGYEKPSTKLTEHHGMSSVRQWHLLLSTYLQEVAEGDADEVHGEDVNVGDTAEVDVSAANDDVPTDDEEPSIPSPTPPPQPSQDIHSTSQRVKKLERKNKVKGRMIVEMDKDADVVLEEAKDVTDDIVKDDQDADEEESKPTEFQKVVDFVTTAKLITEVVTAASTTISATDVPVPAATTVVAPKLTADPSRSVRNKK